MKSPVHPEVEMKKITRHGIEIDYCPMSGGVWLDHGELEKLIAMEKTAMGGGDMAPKFEESTPSHSVPSHQSNHDQKHYKHKKKGSFLEDMFDFF